MNRGAGGRNGRLYHMIVTLHRYILREIVKTFVLTLVSLVVLVSMGGGVANLLRAQGLDALEVLTLFGLFVPVAATFVVPIAAMFAAAMTFGRLSADNELTACRAAGINVHRLFAGALGLGLAAAVFTYYSWNYVIPRFFQTAQRLTELDLGRAAVARLQKNQAVNFRDFALHADLVDPIRIEPDEPNIYHVRLKGVAFFRFDRSAPSTYGTAQVAEIHVDRRGASPSIRADLWRVRSYDNTRGQYIESEHQPIGPYELQNSMRERLGFQDLDTLRGYLNAPWEMREVVGRLVELRRGVVSQAVCNDIAARMGGPDGKAVLSSGDRRYVLSAAGFGRDSRYGEITMKEPCVIVERDGARVRYAAQSGNVTVQHNAARPDVRAVEIELLSVEQTDVDPNAGSAPAATSAEDPAAAGGTSPPSGVNTVRRSEVRFTGIELPREAERMVTAITDQQLLDPAFDAPVSIKWAEYREKLIREFNRLYARLVGLIHFRSAMAASCPAMILLAAFLGVAFRGSQVLTAFGVSCAPAFVTVIAIMAGRNIAEDPDPAVHTIGLAVMWAVDGVLTAAALWVGARFVPR